MKKRLFVIFGLMQLGMIKNSAAQEQNLDPVTVSSSLQEIRSSETGRNILIIPGEEISALPVHSLDELLKYVPGIEVQSRGPQGAQSDISIRGGTFQQVLVILDGLRLNDPNTGHFSAYIPITPAQIDRIEILKGASASVYGSDAVGGVINIITKSFNASGQTKKQVVNAQVSAGEYNLVTVNAGGYLQVGRLSVDAGVLSNNSTGVMLRGERGFFYNTTGSAGLNYRLNDYWNISVRSAYDKRDFAAQNFYTTFASDTATEKVTGWWHQLKIGYEKKHSAFSLNAGYKNVEDEYQYNSLSPANQNTSRLFQSVALYKQTLSNRTSFTAGLNYQNRFIHSNDRGDHTIQSAAPFLNLTQQVGANIRIMPSVRMEFIGSNSPELLPQLNLSWHISNLQLRASGGRTLRDADFTERYNNYNKTLVKSGSVGNPWLVPEISWNYEAGFDWFSKSDLKVSSTFFQRFHSRLIDWVTTPYTDMPRQDNLDTAGSFALAKNIAKVNTTGAELDIQYMKNIGTKQRITVNAGCVWLSSSSSETHPSFYISSHAKFLTNFNIRYQFENISISLTGIYKSRNPQGAPAINADVSKDYFVMNGRISYSFMKNKLGVFIQADNIFNRRYSDLLGSPMPGRWLQGGVSFSFAK